MKKNKNLFVSSFSPNDVRAINNYFRPPHPFPSVTIILLVNFPCFSSTLNARNFFCRGVPGLNKKKPSIKRLVFTDGRKISLARTGARFWGLKNRQKNAKTANKPLKTRKFYFFSPLKIFLVFFYP